MINIDKSKRIVFLYYLGVKIPEYYVDAIEELISYFEQEKFVKIEDDDNLGDGVNYCAMDKNGNIMYVYYKTYKEANPFIEFTYPIKHFLKVFGHKYPQIHPVEYDSMICEVLNYKLKSINIQLSIKKLYVSYHDDEKNKFFVELKGKYDTGNFEFLI